MEYASSGCLEDFLAARTLPSTSPLDDDPSSLSPDQAKAAFRARRKSSSGNTRDRLRFAGGGGEKRGVHLLGQDEVAGLLGGITRGLNYLVSSSLFHFTSLGPLVSSISTSLTFLVLVSLTCLQHDHGILHLDLKPSNVLLMLEEGEMIPRCLISDFGTSRMMFSPTRRGARSGATVCRFPAVPWWSH